MKHLKKQIFPVIAVLASLGLFLATAWLWYDLWQASKMKTETELSIFRPRKQYKDEKPLNPEVKPGDSVTSTSEQNSISAPTKPTITEPRVAVSPLTGTLVLADGDVNLDVPYTSQAPERNWEEPWQNACEEAAVLMLDAFIKGYGLSPLSAKDELQRMVNWEKERSWFTSIDSEKVATLFTEYLGYKQGVKIIENPTLEQIKKFIDEGKPVLALADGKTLPNPYYSNGGPEYHAFIIRGYTKDTFITNDPGVNRGANFVFPIQAVMDSLHDWNDGNVKSGTPVIIVIE